MAKSFCQGAAVLLLAILLVFSSVKKYKVNCSKIDLGQCGGDLITDKISLGLLGRHLYSFRN